MLKRFCNRFVQTYLFTNSAGGVPNHLLEMELSNEEIKNVLELSGHQTIRL